MDLFEFSPVFWTFVFVNLGGALLALFIYLVLSGWEDHYNDKQVLKKMIED